MSLQRQSSPTHPHDVERKTQFVTLGDDELSLLLAPLVPSKLSTWSSSLIHSPLQSQSEIPYQRRFPHCATIIFPRRCIEIPYHTCVESAMAVSLVRGI